MSADRSFQAKKRRGGLDPSLPDVKVGTDRAGFELSVDRPKRLIRLRMWGMWDLSIGEQFRTNVLAYGRGLEGAPWSILADSREFVAQSAAIAEIRKDVMMKILPMGCQKIAALVEQTVYAMQFKRIANESHVGSGVFHDEAAALAWVTDLKGSLPQ
jgi:hypothetical protein